MAMPDHLQVDEREDAINALEHAVELTETLNRTPLNWKWLLIAIHNALQGTLVCTLSGSHGTGALSTRSMTAIWDWYEAPSDDPKAKYPKEWLAPPLELYERAKQENYMVEFGGAPIGTTKEQDEDVHMLNEIRRDFSHYTPRIWAIETAGLPRIVLNVVGVIDDLSTHPAFSYRLKQNQRDRVQRSICQLRHRFLTNHDETFP